MSTEPVQKPTADNLRPVHRWLPRLRHILLAVLIVGLGTFAHREMLTFRDVRGIVPGHGYGLMGFDAYMQVIAARVLSFQDLLDTFTETLTDGRITAQFYRPVQNLLIALDYELWGLEPWGYHLTSLVCFGLTILVLYAAMARMLGPTASIGPAIAALFFGLHPVAINVLPSPARRSDMLVILFLLLVLYVLPVGNKRRGWGRLIAAGLLTLLAAGSKDIGVMALGLVFLHQFFFRFEGGPFRSFWRAWVASLPTAIAAGIYMLNRTVVLKGFGGYQPREDGIELGYVQKLRDFGEHAIADVFCPMIMFPTSWLPPRWGMLEVAVAAGAVLTGLALLFVLGLGLSRLSERRRVAVVLILGMAWMIPPTIVLGLMNWYGPWYGMLPAAGVAMLLGGLAQAGWSMVAGRWWEKLPGLVPLAVVLAIFALPVRYSPLFEFYHEWGRGTLLLKETLLDLDTQMEAAQPGSSLYVKPTPYYKDPPEQRPTTRPEIRWVATTMIKGIQAYAEMKFPHKKSDTVYTHQPQARSPVRPNVVQIRVRWTEIDEEG